LKFYIYYERNGFILPLENVDICRFVDVSVICLAAVAVAAKIQLPLAAACLGKYDLSFDLIKILKIFKSSKYSNHLI
jgi:hypothetical protein